MWEIEGDGGRWWEMVGDSGRWLEIVGVPYLLLGLQELARAEA